MELKILTVWCIWMIILHKVYGQNYVKVESYNDYGNYDASESQDLNLNYQEVPIYRQAYTERRRKNGKRADTTKCFSQPACPALIHQKFSSLDGTCNNRVDRNRGRTLRSYKRLLPAAYADNRGSLRTGVNGPLPNPRFISNTMSGINTISSHLSRFIPWWGQFLIHDIAFTPAVEKNEDGTEFKCKCGDLSPDCINIELPEGDEQTLYQRKTCIPLPRSEPVVDNSMKNCDPTVRQQMNALSGFLDLGTVYGNSFTHLNAILKPHSAMGELMSRDAQDGLPYQDQVTANVSDTILCPEEVKKPVGTPCFVAGDIRVNENSGLMAVHSVMMKKHNQIARSLKEINPNWGADEIFKNSKAILTALYQIVTFREFLPALLGSLNMKRYNLDLIHKGYWYGYDSTLDGTIANVFPAAAFRFGHSMITPHQSRPGPSWTKNQADPILTSQSFFNTEPITDTSAGGVNSLFRGILKDPAMSVDSNFVQAMRNFLFAEGDQFGDDIFAINIQRGRDHGIPGYNQWREFCGLRKAESFKEFFELSEDTRAKLSEIYNHVDDVDLYVAGVAELPVEGGTVGPTFACIIGHQFRDIRNGDRFWHENGGVFETFTEDQLQALRSTSFPRVLCDVIPDMETIQPYPFSISSEYNERRFCESYPPLDLEAWRVDGARQRSSPHNDDTKAAEYTMWFPSTKNGAGIDPGMTLNYLLEFRSDQVCKQVMDSEIRFVNERLQVRFLCAPGTIKYTDCPAVESEEVYWSAWLNNGPPNKAGDDIETNPNHPICRKPLALQAITVEGIHASETGDVFEEFSTRLGFICRGVDQTSGFCQDYMVRYLCRRGDDVATSIRPPTTQPQDTETWSKWVSTDTPDYNGDLEYLRHAIRRYGICRQPVDIEARTINGKISHKNSGDKIRLIRKDYGFFCFNSQQENGRRCRDYEVRYLCKVKSQTSDGGLPYYVKEQVRDLCNNHDVCCPRK